MKRAFMDGKPGVRFRGRGQTYYCDFEQMVQRNTETGKDREIRVVYDGERVEACRPSSAAPPLTGEPHYVAVAAAPAGWGPASGPITAPAPGCGRPVGPSAVQALYGAPTPCPHGLGGPGLSPGWGPAYGSPVPAYGADPPAYAAYPAAAPPSGYAAGPAPGAAGAGTGISPMVAAMAAGAAGLMGGMLIEEAFDRPDVVIAGPGF